MKKIIIPLIIAVTLAVAIALFSWFKPHRNAATEEASHSFSREEVVELFNNHPDSATTLLLDKVIAIHGVVAGVEGADSSQLVLMDGVVGALIPESALPDAGQTITLKGRFTNYDDLFLEIRLDQSTWK